MRQTCNLDFPDDALELYGLGRLDEDQSDKLEEHLLLCETCRYRMEKTDEFISAIRQALVPETPLLAAIRRDRVAVQD